MAFSRVGRLDPPARGSVRKAAVMLCALLASLSLLHCLSGRCGAASPSPLRASSSGRDSSGDWRPVRSKRLAYEWSAGSGLGRASRTRTEPEPPGASLLLPPPRLASSSSGRAPQRFAGKLSPLGEGSKKLPQALIIGVKKGGTRALLEFLRVHPDIRAVGAEPHFFDRNYENGLEWYRELMPKTLEGQITMEKTPSYFVTREAPARISAMSRDTKLIVVVRDPVTRAISDYTQDAVQEARHSLFREPHLQKQDYGAHRHLVERHPDRHLCQAKHLDNWLQYFPMEQILFTKGFPCLKKAEGSSKPHCLGKTKGRTHPNIDPEVVQRLRDFYRPFNMKFYQMTERFFGWDD
ncbi:hypothetical protein L3Q82_000974 [Scortum barcoo]|uniref:Uncharacterized protein n=1 Tax=Scortum barcoo TaxID=214431 RepID=A0ACB8WAH7_9TELE|nr:hypothetical protein L3Q82_000974 [Scortum barcoo]